jgi:manganese/zinc/iron transport system ATP- binding protein
MSANKEAAPALEVHNLTATYDRQPVLWDIDFSLPEGSLAGILGPNGSGKTTLLRNIMGLMQPDSGYVRLLGQDLAKVRAQVSYVPQRESVDWNFPVSVSEVVAMGRYGPGKLLRRLRRPDRDIIEEAMERTGILPLAHRHISQLSGGQQQRVFIARALAQQAQIYLMDEPFVGVDAATEEAILNLLGEMKNRGHTVIMVHHDLQTAQDFFDQAVLLQTRLVAAGPVETVLNKENLQQAYGGRLNVLSKVGQLAAEKQFPLREKAFRERKKPAHGESD